MNVVTTPLPMVEREPIDEFASLYYHYEIEKEVGVISFLRKYPFLLSILEETPCQIYRIFGEDILLRLELHHDPEEGWDELFIVIKSAHSAEEANRLENRLAEEWFLDRIRDTRGKLNITEEPL